jgi:hypothetical protein
MGSDLARMEVRVMVEETLARVDSVAALGEPRLFPVPGGSGHASRYVLRSPHGQFPAAQPAS